MVVGTATQAQLTQIGVTELRTRYGVTLPDGDNVIGWQTEAEINVNVLGTTYGVFWPNLLNSQITLGRNITLSGGPFPPDPTAVSSDHATSVGTQWYGAPTTGVSPGMAELVSMSADSFVGGAALQTLSGTAPVVGGSLSLLQPDVVNASWAGSSGLSEIDTDVLRRIDYLVDRDGVTVVAAAGNTPLTVPTALPGQGYNTITVGISNGTSNGGLSTVDGAGRVLVDVVTPNANTSTAAPLVAGAATLIIDRARVTGSLANAEDPRVVRSLIMTGAEKLAGWTQSPTQPVDLYQGAGELRVNRTYDVLMSGEKAVGTAADTRGWDLGATTGTTQYYFVDSLYDSGRLSVTLTWNRVTGDAADPTGSNRTGAGNFTTMGVFPVLAANALADLNLEVLTTDGSSTPLTSLAVSQSTVDNVEHIYLQGLAPGRYAIAVSGAAGTTYGLSFNFVPEVPAGWPVGLVGLAGLGWVGWRRRHRA